MFDVMGRVKDISVPTLAIYGDEDNLTPARNHEYLRDHMPNCRMEVIEQAGHWTYIEQPEAFNRVVRPFLADLA